MWPAKGKEERTVTRHTCLLFTHPVHTYSKVVMNRQILCQFLTIFCILSLSLSRGLAIPKDGKSKRVLDKVS